MILKKEVSDGIVAPGYSPEALEILKSKKGGKFIVLEAKADFKPDSVEYREVYGMTFCQKRNDVVITKDHMTKNVVTKGGLSALGEDAIRDMIVASICVKYTQSNSVGFAKDGMMVGVGAGQQSRVDCVKLAGRKVTTPSAPQGTWITIQAGCEAARSRKCPRSLHSRAGRPNLRLFQTPSQPQRRMNS